MTSRSMHMLVSVVVALATSVTSNPLNQPNSPVELVINHAQYHGYSQIKDYLGGLAQKYPDFVHLSYLPHTTYEGNKVITVKLSTTNPEPSSQTKPSILIEAGTHAREYIAPAATLYVIDKLLQEYQQGNNLSNILLDTYDWYFVPVNNPDGYEYTFTDPKNRGWRKNTRHFSVNGTCCMGVDVNRNFDFKFGTVGVHHNCSGELYPGPHAFSEPESRNLRDLFATLNSTIKAFVSVHSYGRLILVPFSHTKERKVQKNILKMVGVLQSIRDALRTEQKYYGLGRVPRLLNQLLSGSSFDWAATQNSQLLSITVELPPTAGSQLANKFALPEKEIVPVGKSFLDGLKAMAEGLANV